MLLLPIIRETSLLPLAVYSRRHMKTMIAINPLDLLHRQNRVVTAAGEGASHGQQTEELFDIRIKILRSSTLSAPDKVDDIKPPSKQIIPTENPPANAIAGPITTPLASLATSLMSYWSKPAPQPPSSIDTIDTIDTIATVEVGNEFENNVDRLPLLVMEDCHIHSGIPSGKTSTRTSAIRNPNLDDDVIDREGRTEDLSLEDSVHKLIEDTTLEHSVAPTHSSDHLKASSSASNVNNAKSSDRIAARLASLRNK
jgi:hypothetical protein